LTQSVYDDINSAPHAVRLTQNIEQPLVIW